MAMEPSRIVIKSIQVNGNATYAMEEARKSIKRKDIDIRETLQTIDTTVMEF